MIIESIKLENFRQFQDEYIEFADGTNSKNVTIILGENGSGKTTFAQAFFWCMYGETSFADKKLLNTKVANQMLPNETKDVRVTLWLKHGLNDYMLVRKQCYTKTMSKIVAGNSSFEIAIKNSGDGTLRYEPKTQCEYVVNSILPKELSRYFFFDGERIENMSKDIASGKKSDDFARAVSGLLGLNGMQAAIKHFNGSTGVLRSYDKEFDSNSDLKIAKYTADIEESREQLDKIKIKIEDAEADKDKAKAVIQEKENELKQYEESVHIQNEKERLTKHRKQVEIHQMDFCTELFKTFNTNTSAFFSKNLIYRALDVLKNEDISDTDIPYMHVKTIEYLLKKGSCICGTHLDAGSVPYQKVKALMDYLPPQSIGTSVSQFKKDAMARIGALKKSDFVEQIQDAYALISADADELTNTDDEIRRIDETLSGGDVSTKVQLIHKDIKFCQGRIANDENIIRDAIRNQGIWEEKLHRADSERATLSLKSDKNAKIQIEKAYAEVVFKQLNDVYCKSEQAVRTELQDKINSIFNNIYNGDLSLTISEKYHISVTVNGYDVQNVETSTAQSISVIFAFIAAIIKMARENKEQNDGKDEEHLSMIQAEPYPLVMDAPLSAFDKKRIKAVCEALPDVAEQVVIFIKDTDGDLAEEYMSDKIGARHHFEKIDAFETRLK
ncbi:MAG: AAA family ATPase [Oscillospiraceae bacterium]|jgi:DNA sulfur modification protein DndD|uniref:AAA family ATPase n=1 Tax=Faecalibacterium prausnitzii TaxID=853 RepID=UPI0022DF6AA8|nr:AAA family ATPase [Faecalibacterium prausnitzii]UYI70160.1 MAG: AAA family ATPase [Oscillospiraceae bacterium]